MRRKVFETLRMLVENAGHLVTKEALLRQVWPEAVVEENNINANVSVPRKALGERENGQQYIETVPRIGYRFVAEVMPVEQLAKLPVQPPVGPKRPAPTTAAWVLRGSGWSPHRIRHGGHRFSVKAADWLNHLEFWESSPRITHTSATTNGGVGSPTGR